MEEERLDILRSLAAGIAVTHMTDCHFARQFRHLLFVEDFCHQTVSFHSMEKALRIYCNDAASLLTSVLESMKAVIRKVRRIRHSIYSKNTTFMMEAAVGILIYIITTLTHFKKIKSPDKPGMTISSISDVIHHGSTRPHYQREAVQDLRQ